MINRPLPSPNCPAERHVNNKWHITRQVDIFWLLIVVGMAAIGTTASWVYSLNNRITTLEVATKIDSANIQYQLSNINAQLNQINSKLENPPGN